ncbi:hypothetical protein BOTBODRAFT_180691 [Botryobasidium botryosum FD-172 SS1]|uniref:PX domain-containing protein n=1 Tax=Botryobasidium botryosum (strain FD-172 SS1) TaxID=930990 RepID=A0A067M6C9_BOTB1|nr:hypothetical protein BOTBODRAFT_180691 [Botryobasidium botryosum FD-172 SS1]
MTSLSPQRPLKPASLSAARLSKALSDSGVTDFDTGVNTSVAWTEHLSERSSDSESEAPDGNPKEREGDDTLKARLLGEGPPKPARALYDFDGQEDLNELTMRAGDNLLILREKLSEGWSVARKISSTADPDEPMGLIPRTYYQFTSEFQRIPSPPTPDFIDSPPPIATPEPLQLQTTGSGSVFPNLRQNLLGGKSLNRFSGFVTSGAEDWVLNGVELGEGEFESDEKDRSDREEGKSVSELEESEADLGTRNRKLKIGEADRHFVEAPPAWKSKSPPFRILVHSPSKRTSSITGAYILYSITSVFHPPDAGAASTSMTPNTEPTHLTVYRRFSHFNFLHTALLRRLPGIALPPLPEKQYAGRFSDDFVEARRGDLERWINRVVRHPVARYAEVLVFFLGCESDAEWRRTLPKYISSSTTTTTTTPSFYAHVFHPAFNFDADDAADAVDRFERHLEGVGTGVQGLRSVFEKVRESGITSSAAQRALSYSILSLITSTPMDNATPATSPATYGYPQQIYEEDEDDDGAALQGKVGLLNEEGAWCWREDCEVCLRLTKALQKMAESLQAIADLHDDHARRTQLATHEMLKDVAHPKALYNPVIDTHRATLSRYKDATSGMDTSSSPSMDSEVAARCETVLNTTMAEFETYHVQKGEDFERIAVEHLDGEIEFHEQVLARLRAARAAFPTSGKGATDVLPPGPRQPSIYERNLATARFTQPAPLPQPAPHIFDSTASVGLRPVSVAVRESMAMLFGNSVSSGGGSGFTGRGSIFDFSRFW